MSVWLLYYRLALTLAKKTQTTYCLSDPTWEWMTGNGTPWYLTGKLHICSILYVHTLWMFLFADLCSFCTECIIILFTREKRQSSLSVDSGPTVSSVSTTGATQLDTDGNLWIGTSQHKKKRFLLGLQSRQWLIWEFIINPVFLFVHQVAVGAPPEVCRPPTTVALTAASARWPSTTSPSI